MLMRASLMFMMLAWGVRGAESVVNTVFLRVMEISNWRFWAQKSLAPNLGIRMREKLFKNSSLCGTQRQPRPRRVGWRCSKDGSPKP